MFLEGFQNIFHQFPLDALEHLVDVGVMQVESGTVDINLINQFFYRDFLDIFLLHQPGKTGSKLCTGLSHPAIHFFSFFRFHKNPP